MGKLQGYIQTGDASDLEIVVSWKNAFRLHERSETLPDGKLTQRSGSRKSRFREKIYEAQRNALRVCFDFQSSRFRAMRSMAKYTIVSLESVRRSYSRSSRRHPPNHP